MDLHEHAISFARRTGWTSRLPARLQADLLAVARLKVLSEGSRLYAIGGPPGGLVGIVSGCLAVEAAQSAGSPQKNLLLHPGAWTGEGPVAGLESRMTGTWATRESHVLLIEIADFRRVAMEHPDAWRHLVLLALETHRKTIGLAQDLMVRGGRQRLRAILARLGGLHEEYTPDPAIVDATQSEVADIANLSRSVVSRLLQELEREGVVRLGWGTIEILKPQRLLQSISPG